MTALTLEKIDGKGAVCLEPTCKKAGRYRVRILGEKLSRPARLRQGTIEDTLCPPHAEEWAERWAELSGAPPAEDREAVAA